LLAAATAGRAGEQAVDLGAGVGGAGLALAARVGGLKVTLIEIDAALSRLAAENARLNHMDDRVTALACDVEDVDALAAAGLGPGSAERVLMNPPFHDARRHNVSPDARRRLAHAGAPGLLERWIASAAWLLKPGGVLTLIWRADTLEDVLAALAGAFGGIAVLPVAPREGAAPIRVLVRAVKGGTVAPVHLPALILNDAQDKPTPAVEAVLRGGQALSLAAV
jgi:tRNA1(Val) A37 N6-methylase TrmN6